MTVVEAKRNKALAVTATTITLLTFVIVGLVVVTGVVSRVAACLNDPECVRWG